MELKPESLEISISEEHFIENITCLMMGPCSPKSVKRPKRISPPMQSQYPSTSLGYSNLTGGDMGSVAVKASLKASAMEKERQQAQMQREAAMQAQLQPQREREAQLQKEKEAQLQAQ
jgi:hypothetical protein